MNLTAGLQTALFASAKEHFKNILALVCVDLTLIQVKRLPGASARQRFLRASMDCCGSKAAFWACLGRIRCAPIPTQKAAPCLHGSVSVIATFLTVVPNSGTFPANLAHVTGRSPGDTGRRGECGSCGRRLVSAAPGRLRARTPGRHYDRPARSFAGLGQRAAGNARGLRYGSQEARYWS